MIVLKPTEFLKAKYTKRWKGKDGKWHYEYAKPKGEGRSKKADTDSDIGTPKAAGKNVDHVRLREDLDREYGGAFVDKLIHGTEATLQSFISHHDPKVAQYAQFHLTLLQKRN